MLMGDTLGEDWTSFKHSGTKSMAGYRDWYVANDRLTQAITWLEVTRERRKVASIRLVQTVLVMATQLAMT